MCRPNRTNRRLHSEIFFGTFFVLYSKSNRKNTKIKEFEKLTWPLITRNMQIYRRCYQKPNQKTLIWGRKCPHLEGERRRLKKLIYLSFGFKTTFFFEDDTASWAGDAITFSWRGREAEWRLQPRSGRWRRSFRDKEVWKWRHKPFKFN